MPGGVDESRRPSFHPLHLRINRSSTHSFHPHFQLELQRRLNKRVPLPDPESLGFSTAVALAEAYSSSGRSEETSNLNLCVAYGCVGLRDLIAVYGAGWKRTEKEHVFKIVALLRRLYISHSPRLLCMLYHLH